MNDDKVAKNLLRNRICRNCEYSSRGRLCLYDNNSYGVEFSEVTENNTCEHWAEPSKGHRGGKEDYV